MPKFKAKKNKAPEFALRKRAFDAVMAHYRSLGTVRLSAMSYGNGCAGSFYAARPKSIDYKIDCDRVFIKCLKFRSEQERFAKAYIFYDSDDPIDREIFAQSILGDKRHTLEQGIGALFLKRELYPAVKYFRAIRGKKVKPQFKTRMHEWPVRAEVAEVVEVNPKEIEEGVVQDEAVALSSYEAESAVDIQAAENAEWSAEDLEFARPDEELVTA
jgi:hypothetical protein